MRVGDQKITFGMLAGLAVVASPCVDAQAQTTAAQPTRELAHSSPPLMALTVDGATLLSNDEIASSYESYLAKPVTLDDLTVIADKITDRYHKRGFFLSRAVVPPQTLRDGVARLVVIEGRISSISVEGDGAPLVRKYFADLGEGTPANIAVLDQRLALARDVPGISVRTRIEPNVDDPVLHRLIVTANLKRISAYASVDNRGTHTIGPWQSYATIAFNSAFGDGDQLSFSGFTSASRPQEFGFIGAIYSAPISTKERIGASLSGSRTEDGMDPYSADVGGESISGSLFYERSLVRRKAVGVWASANFEVRHQENEWILADGYVDDTRVLSISMNAALTDPHRETRFNAQSSFGLRGLGASGPSTVRRSRYDADGSFAKINLAASHYHDVGPNMGVLLAASGQWSADPLLASEEFTVGGSPFGRGYAYGEIGGDRGAAVLLELRAGFRPTLAPLSFVQGYTFFDAGRVENFHAPKAQQLSSAGVGARVRLADRLELRIETAKPLSRVPFEKSDKAWRTFFGASVSF